MEPLLLSQQKAGRGEWIGLVILALPTLLVSVDMTVTYLALPVLSTALKPSSAQLLWITDIFGFLDAGVLIVVGTLGDRLGTRKLLLTGSIIFACATTLAAFSPNANVLIFARAILGVSGAILLTSILSLIRNMFHNNTERTFAMGIYTTCFSTGTMLGPLIGGFLLARFWWGSVFLVGLPIMVILLATAPFLLPENKPAKTGTLDVASAIMLIVATLTVTYGIKETAQNGVGILSVIIICMGVLSGIIFLRRQMVLAHPLIDIQLFRKRSFNLALLALMIALFSWSGLFFFVGQYLQLVTGLDTLHAGFAMMPSAAGSILLCMLAPVAVKRFKRGYLIATGLFILATGISLLALAGEQSLGLLIIATILMSSGCGATVTLGIDMVIASAPREKAGAAAGISETSTALGGSFGIALLGSLWTMLYRNQVNTNLPNSLSARQVESIRGTLGGAFSVAQKLQSTTANAIIQGSKQAFVDSLHITAGTCAILVYIVAIIVAAKLNRAMNA